MSFLAASGLCIDFPFYHGEGRSLKKAVLARARGGRIGAGEHRRLVVHALRDIDFELGPGDRLGLIGANGSGKTTLLRALAGIYQPTAGAIRMQGTLGALLDLQQGFDPLMTGRENIRMRGLFERQSPAEIDALEQDVAAFADLNDFLDLPLRTYSSGMMLRLGFALATATRPEILLMDEWVLAGDADFMRKARARLESMVRRAEIFVLSSHSPGVLLEWCNRLIWLEQGRIRLDGEPREVLAAYLPPEEFRALPVPERQGARGLEDVAG